MSLTAAQQDYIEIVYQLEQENPETKIRITDIAEKLGTRLPTVTRMVKRLTDLGYLSHKSHGGVNLTSKGQTVAGELTHLHNDLILFFTEILGISKKQADYDACQTEHALSPLTAQRLHEFLIYYNELPSKEKYIIQQFKKIKKREPKKFKNLPKNRTSGWRY